MSRTFCFTVDLDRDVNMTVPGQIEAGSLDRGSGTAPRFTSTDRGLSLLTDLLDDIGMHATFFAEGRTLEMISNTQCLNGYEVGVHGYDHEDLTGESNGVSYGPGEISARITKTCDLIHDITGKNSVSFRAPYMKIDQEIIDMLPDLGLMYDSSVYVPMAASLMPQKYSNGIVEIPVPEGKDRNGKKIAAYLWPMHEGKRVPDDYLKMASETEEGIFVLATHTWHLTESRAHGNMDSGEIKNNMDNLRLVLEGIADMGFSSETIFAAGSRWIR